MEEEHRPKHEHEMRHKPLSREDAYFQKLEEDRLKAIKTKDKPRRMLCGRKDRPADGCPLVHEERHGIIVDACQECGGIWLDAHEAQLIRRTLEQDPKEDLWKRLLKNLLPYQE